MSKICVKCGNVIPDGMDVCPNCGQEGYDDSDFQNVLKGMGLSSEDNPDHAESEDAASTADEPTVRIPVLDEMDAPSEEGDSSVSDEPVENSPKSVEELLKDSPDPEKPKKSSSKKKQNHKRTDGIEKQPLEEKKKARMTENETQQEELPEEEEPQRNSAAIIGIVIGLIIALLVIGCGVAFMLFRMGFFTSMSDEDLLNAPGKETTLVTVSPAEETPMPPEGLEAMGSELESSAAETPMQDPEVPEEEQIVCTKFNITGTEYIILYSRGVTTEISYVIEPAELRDKITWESSDETVATVDSNGTIRARRGGMTVITGSCGGKAIKAYVTNDFTVPDTILDMNMEDITMSYEGQTAQLAIDYDLTDEYIKATTWESSDPDVAMVDKDGVVTAISNGTAVITASLGEYTASCIVRCVNVTGNRGYNNSDSEFVINYEDVTLSRKGEYFQLTLKSILGNKMPDFTWSSDDPEVATVDSKGVVTAVADGTAHITTSIGQDKFQCIVRVRISD